MAIEDVAHETPEKIFKIHIEMKKGLTEDDLKDVPKNLGLEENSDEIKEIFRKLYKICLEKDADMVEINPMVKLKEGKMMAIDGKVTIDDNAAFRHKELADAEDKSAKNAKELAAEKWNLNYIHLGGTIGCLVNGAGLAMATMDIVKMYGGTPSNFLDVGGGTSGPAMVEAMKLVHNDDEVDAIFVNIFGGILRCDELVKSVIQAHQDNKFTKPIVLRIKGTNDQIAEELIRGKEKELGITFTKDFDFAAREVVKIAQQVHSNKGFADRHGHGKHH